MDLITHFLTVAGILAAVVIIGCVAMALNRRDQLAIEGSRPMEINIGPVPLSRDEPLTILGVEHENMPSGENWEDWNGGESPVPEGALVDIQVSSGAIGRRLYARNVFWGRDNDRFDVVRWRLHQLDERPILLVEDSLMAGVPVFMPAAEEQEKDAAEQAQESLEARVLRLTTEADANGCVLVARDDYHLREKALIVARRYVRSPSERNFLSLKSALTNLDRKALMEAVAK